MGKSCYIWINNLKTNWPQFQIPQDGAIANGCLLPQPLQEDSSIILVKFRLVLNKRLLFLLKFKGEAIRF